MIVDIPLEYFPSLFQQSHHTDIISNETGEVFLYKPEVGKIVTSALDTLFLRINSFYHTSLELNILHLAINFISIFTRLVLALYFCFKCHFIY